MRFSFITFSKINVLLKLSFLMLAAHFCSSRSLLLLWFMPGFLQNRSQFNVCVIVVVVFFSRSSVSCLLRCNNKVVRSCYVSAPSTLHIFMLPYLIVCLPHFSHWSKTRERNYHATPNSSSCVLIITVPRWLYFVHSLP